jgi:hypothetical protein
VTIAASAVDDTQLPPNPISHILVAIRYQTLAANVLPTLANILAVVDPISVLHRGTSVFSMSAADLWAYMVGHGLGPSFPFRLTTPVNSSGFLVLVIPFGRALYDSAECFPCTRAGELVLRMNRAAADTAITGVQFTVTTVELPEAQPERFLRATTLAFTPAATGDNDLQLFPSTVYTGLLVFSTTVPTGIVFTTTVDRVQLILNNIQYDVAQANWEDLWGEWLNRGGLSGSLTEHIHLENTAGAYAQNADTGAVRTVAHQLRQYVWVDLDPSRDLSYAIDARNIARVVLRVNAGDVQPVRVIPQEMIFLAENGGGGG